MGLIAVLHKVMLQQVLGNTSAVRRVIERRLGLLIRLENPFINVVECLQGGHLCMLTADGTVKNCISIHDQSSMNLPPTCFLSMAAAI
jgi:hypothetical protein